MKKLTVLILAAASILVSCNQTPSKEVQDAKENLVEAKEELKDAQTNESMMTQAKETEDWNNFKSESEKSMESIENDMKKMEAKLDKAGDKERQRLKADYANLKTKMSTLKEKLHARHIEFESDVKVYDQKVSEKNQAFKREFKHDMDDLGASIKNLFSDDVK